MGDPKVGRVKVNGKVTKLCRLPGANEEAEMVSRLLRVSSLVAEKASKEEVMRRIQEVGLVHIAAYGDAERGEIALAPNVSHGTKKRLCLLSKASLKARERPHLITL